jgi:hypothetical protein
MAPFLFFSEELFRWKKKLLIFNGKKSPHTLAFVCYQRIVFASIEDASV